MSTQTAGTRERSAHNEPRVSVVTIFFNGEQFLEKAIRSVFDQTFTDWELLLVDDGSTDRSGELARRLAARHPDRIRYLSHPGLVNLGMSASRNLGLRRARGEYIAFRDADDVYLPEKLDRQVSALDEHPHVGMVYSKTLCWYSWTSEASDLDIPRKLGVATGTVIHPPDLIPLYLRHAALTPATCSVLLRRSAALQVGGFEFQFRGMYEDQVFFFKVALAHDVVVLDGILDRYRQHDASFCRLAEREGLYNPEGPHPTEHIFLSWVEQQIDASSTLPNSIRDDVRSALRTRLQPYRRSFAQRVRLSLTRIAGLVK